MAKHTRSVLTCFVHPRILPLAGPPRSAMLVREGRVVGFQEPAEAPRVRLPGAAVLPAFADAHLHLFPLIERAVGVDCRGVSSLPALLARLAAAPGTGWVRATGYDLGALHPTRADLDAATTRPVRLLHRTGHLAVMNSPALRAIPPAVWERGQQLGYVEYGADGEPTGRLWEPAAWLSGAVVPPLSAEEIRRGLASVAASLFARGITAVHDASPTNDAARLALWAHQAPPFRLLFLPGETTVLGPEAALPATPLLAVGPTKVMLPDLPDELPSLEALAARLSAIGRPVAIHAVIHPAVRLAVEAARAAGVPARIEHAAEWPPDLFAPARAAGVTVVVHPSWVRERAARYLAEVDAAILPWLHRGRSFLDAGIPILFGSDAPASEPDPIGALATAVTRRAADGTLLSPAEALPLRAALRASVGGRAALDPASKDGALRIGAAADFIVLDRDPFTTPPDALAAIRVIETYCAGARVWPPSS
ncbi:MAG: amidohydrolase family protein [Chloroflexota bacterium]|nr:amidohydrolase family protein [Dehalococcoidia bacterium]MDW8252306.1 amidohydrolase family protein [Chloroflexota bacterium]